MKRIGAAMGIASSCMLVLFACVGSDPEPVAPGGTSGSSGNSSGDGAIAQNDGSPGVVDGGEIIDEDSGYVPPAKNVLKRSGFEDSDCLGWANNQAKLVQFFPRKHSGQSSCLVCAKNASSSWAIGQDVLYLDAGTYTAQAFFHAAPENSNGVQSLAVGTEYRDDAGVPAPGGKEVTVDFGLNDPTWTEVRFDVTIRANGEGVWIGAVVDNGEDGFKGCFLVDDFTLTPKD